MKQISSAGAGIGGLAAVALLAAPGRAVTVFDPFNALRPPGSGRWHVRSYQAFSAAFTPQYQSDSRWLPALRDRILFPASQLPPLPRVRSALVCGSSVPPLGSLSRR